MDQQHQHSQIYRTRIWILMGYLGYSDVQQKAKQLWSEIIHSWCEIIQWYSPQPCSIIRVMLSHLETQHSEPRTLVLNRQRKQEEVRRVKGTQFYDWRKVLRLIFFFQARNTERFFFVHHGGLCIHHIWQPEELGTTWIICLLDSENCFLSLIWLGCYNCQSTTGKWTWRSKI